MPLDLRIDPISISPQTPLRLRYRIYTHTGDVTEGRVREAWEVYRAAANPLKLSAIAEPEESFSR